MSQQITTAFVQQYGTDVRMLLQQMDSRLSKAVQRGSHVGKFVSPVDQVGSVEAKERTERHGDTPIMSTPHARRWVRPKDYEVADLLDKVDQKRMLFDAKGPYQRAQAAALNRKRDAAIIAAFNAIASTGEDGTGTESFDTTNYQIVAGGTGLTVAKLRTAKRKLMAANVDLDADQLFVGLTAAQHDDLLGELQVVSLDYNNRPVLVDGRVTSFMGFNFIHTELFTKVSTTRTVWAWAKSGMYLADWTEEVMSRVSERDDKSYSWQVYSAATFGATRLENGRVIQIDCNEP